MILNTYKCIIDEYKTTNFNGNLTGSRGFNTNGMKKSTGIKTTISTMSMRNNTVAFGNDK